MSLLTALYSGSSGIDASTDDLSVISNNISNENTIGFKMSRSDFEEALSDSLLGAGQIGTGTNMQMVQQIVSQGSLEQTGNATDLALQGNGMFVVAGSENGVTGNFYTRDGEFTMDSAGYLVNQSGMRVQGYSADSSGGIGSALGDLDLGTATSDPQATANITIQANLSSTATVPLDSSGSPAPFDPTNITGTTSAPPSSVTIYDSLGDAHQATIYYTKTASGSWDWNATVDGSAVNGGTAGTPSIIASGTLSFDTTGKLTAETTTTDDFEPIGATAPQALNFNFGSPTGSGGSGTDGVTGFASASATVTASQDGYAAGTLSSVSVGTDGTITGVFSNGQQQAVGQVAVANFAAPDRLESLGGNLYMATPDAITAGALGEATGGEGAGGTTTVSGSGEASIGVAGTGGRGSITSGALEESNVNITDQFVDMIAAQRSFEANSKTITTADTMLSDLIQMKR